MWVQKLWGRAMFANSSPVSLFLILMCCVNGVGFGKPNVIPLASEASTVAEECLDSSFPLPSLASCRVQNLPFDCRALINGDASDEEVASAKAWTIPQDEIITPERLLSWSRNCSHLTNMLGLITSSLTNEEANYPLAYTWLIYKNLHQFLFILRRVYRPQNLYCVHVDNSSESDLKASIVALTHCLPNVILPQRHYDVEYYGATVLAANYECMRSLHLSDHPWKYVQTLTGTDFPLRSNAEMVQMFQIFNGTSDSEAYTFIGTGFMSRLPNGLTGLPGGLELFGGNTGVALSREFMRFLFTNDVALQFYNWSLQTHVPDEMFFATLIHNLHVQPPGGFPGHCIRHRFEEAEKTRKPFMARYQAWNGISPCLGSIDLYSCVFGVSDLPLLARKPHLLAHKFETYFEPAAQYCLDELICNRTLDPGNLAHAAFDFSFNASFYRSLPGVVYHHMQDISRYECQA